MKINWKVRVTNPTWWISLISVILMPIFSYMGITGEMLTSWGEVGRMFETFISTPYLIGIVIIAVLQFLGINTDPTTKGISDSEQAMTYHERQ